METGAFGRPFFLVRILMYKPCMAVNIQRALGRAGDRARAGAWAECEELCREVLDQAPRNPEALHLLGAARLAAGHAEEAASCIELALQADGRNPVMLEHLGIARLALRDPAAAEAAFRRAAQLGAGHALLDMRLGLALLAQRRLAEALVALRDAAAKAPDEADVQLNLGNALAESGAAEEALTAYRKVVALQPGRPDGHFNLGTQLMRMARLDEAESAYQSALSVDPRYEDAHHNLGLLAQQRGRFDEAVSHYRSAIALNPRHGSAWNNLGNALRAGGRLDEAAAAHEQAIASDRGLADAYVNLGITRVLQGRLQAARAGFEQALAIEPSSADALYNRGLLDLYCHDFESGWPGYAQRLQSAPVRSGIRKEAATLQLYEGLPRWRGPGEPGVTDVAIWSEQGIGDQILFSTLVPELAEAGVPFVYEVDPRLLGAYERAWPAVRFLPMSDPPHAQLQSASRVLLAGSLPSHFRRSVDSFSRQPRALLSPLPARVAHYRERIGAMGPGRAVALSWRSVRKDWLIPDKSAALIDFLPLLQTNGVQFVDVQYGDTAVERQQLTAQGGRLGRFDDVDYFNDLEELLAIIAACDLLITSSNVNAHLAGALGKPTWLLFPADRAPFHYWAQSGGGRSLWYPSVEIVTAPHVADWPRLIRHVVEKLARYGG